MSDTEPTKTTTASEPAPAAPVVAQDGVKDETVKASEPAAPQPAAVPTAASAVTPAPAAPTTAPAAETGAKAADASKIDVKAKEAEEPQNALTERFTQAEWNALKEFRKLLPEMFAAAYDQKADAKTTPITLWGVKIVPTNPLDARTSVVLMKFLRARNLNPTAAKDMFIATLRWRDEFNVDAACKEQFPDDVFGKLGYIYGKDKEGRPVVYNVYGGNKDIKAVFGDVQRFLRWRVAFMEKSIQQLDFETVDQMIQIHDYEGVSMSSRDANSKNAASEASSIFSSHYPELLYKKFFVNVPSYLTWIFWIFKPLLPAATLAKMSVVGTGSHTIGKSLLPHVNAKDLPKGYGGEAEAF
ncbi:cral trio domain protein [Moniliophthora roreri MCA 2997]|uniref:Phosphatidylinositol transfer protein SFH5 n=2 Tax=Moniliophthora roreri TaxID=221103 RepID=V2Z1N6_MONRO|nr:cral trio domain protein [Moniliophthora roreri MCA 2997]KAI3602631.1 cral trio domain protein [Moniliophthora roreri]